MSRDLDAAVLAGGLGTRLRSVVADRPKVLAPVNGRPYLFLLLDQLADAGVGRVVLLVGHRAGMVRDALGERYRGMRLLYSEEATPLGTGGAVRHALPLLTAPRVLLLNGDSYCECDLAALNDGPARMAVARVPDVSRYGEVTVADDGRVVAFGEKSGAARPGWINAGVYSVPRAQLETLPDVRPLSLERDVFPRWARDGLLVAAPAGGRFLDIGTPESFAAAGAFFREGCHAG
ncbi:MAG: nucleotidyltransferase family protein [Gemmataceae bacterium]